MTERRRRKPHPNAVRQYRPHIRARRPVDQPLIALLRHHHVHVDATHRCQGERRPKALVRQEIRCHNHDAFPRTRHRLQHGEFDLLHIFVGPGAYHARGDAGIRVGLQHREPCLALQGLACRELPVLRKGLGELPDNGTFEPEMRVLHGVFRVPGQNVIVGDVQSAGKPDAAVQHEDLLVRTQVQERHAPRQRRVQETRRLHASPPQRVIGRRAHPAAAYAVDQHAHGQAASLRRLQRVHEPRAPHIVLEQVGGQAHAVFGCRDSRQHRRISLVTVLQNRDRVAAEQRPPADPPVARPQRGQMRVPVRLRGGAGRRRWPAAARPKPTRPALHPVDAQHVIGCRAGERCEPCKPYPRDRSGHLTLAQQHMQRHADRQHQAEGEENDVACVK